MSDNNEEMFHVIFLKPKDVSANSVETANEFQFQGEKNRIRKKRMKNQVFRIWKQCLSLCFVHLFILSNKQVQRGGKSNQSLIQSRKREKSSRSKIYLGGRQGGDRATDNLKVRRRWKTQENSIMVTDHRMKGLLPQDIRGKRRLYCEY